MPGSAEVSTLLIALIAALSALGGSAIPVIAQFFLEKGQRNHQRAVLIRERYEEFANCISAQRAWHHTSPSSNQKESGCKGHPQAFSRYPTFAHSPEALREEYLPGVQAALIDALRARSLAYLYFPPTRQLSDQYLDALSDLRRIISLSRVDEEGKMDTAELESALAQVTNTRSLLEQSLITNADKYAKA